MRLVVRIFGGLLAALVALAVALLVASEIDEVVVLHTRDAEGEMASVRLWIVDLDGEQWLRAGGVERGWFRRVRAQPEVTLERDGERGEFRAVVIDEPAARERVDAAMREKYGTIDALILWLERTSHTVPIRLEPRG